MTTFYEAAHSLYGLPEGENATESLAWKQKVEKHMNSRRHIYTLKKIPIEYWFLEAEKELRPYCEAAQEYVKNNEPKEKGLTNT